MTDRSEGRVRPASALERQFWLGERIAPSSPANWVLAHVRADGPVDLPSLDAALAAVAHRQEALRTGFRIEDGEVVRVLLAESVAEPALRLAPGTGFDEAAAALLGPGTFDITAGRVHRAAVAPDAQGATVFLAVHHIAFDGLSQEIFASDLAQAYARAVDGGDPHLPVRERQAVPSLDPGRRATLAAHWRALLTGADDLPGPIGGTAAATGPSQRELAAAAWPRCAPPTRRPGGKRYASRPGAAPAPRTRCCSPPTAGRSPN